jgi:glycosyltransferase involved in cell wall biosynthesis
MKVCAVLAAYNEAPNLPKALEGIRAVLKPDDDILVVDDGSKDNTSEVAKECGARVVRQEPNQGKGAAIRRGLKEATGDIILFIDVDGQDDPAEIPKLLAEMEKGADLANGSKFIGHIDKGAISLPNWFGNQFMSGLISLLYGQKITDSQAGYRTFRRSKIAGINWTSTEYEIETEMLIKSIKKGLKVVEVPVGRYERTAGATSFKRIRNGLRILWMIIKLRFVEG